MRTITKTELAEILEKHKLWRWKKAGGKRADLSEADLHGADLRCADLRCANLSGADLSGANLSGADLRYAKNIDDVIWSLYTAFYPLQCPESGAFVGYKKTRGYIIKLEICEDALRSSANSRKCRCSKAKVLEIQFMNGTHCALDKIQSDYDPNFVYTVGEIVEVKNFDMNRWNECAPGIHFFITREEAVKY